MEHLGTTQGFHLNKHHAYINPCICLCNKIVESRIDINVHLSMATEDDHVVNIAIAIPTCLISNIYITTYSKKIINQT